MITIDVKASRPYRVEIESGGLRKFGARISALHKLCRVLLVADDTVDGLYGDVVRESLEEAGFDVVRFVFRHGEQSKTLDTYQQILGSAARNRLRRSDLMVALGGGVTGDLTGFAAATYLRGVDYVQIPTTLLAAIDSSVGGKTGVDLPEGKNLVGAFHQPLGVFCDPDVFRTLPTEVLRDGIGESLKYAVLDGGVLLETLEQGDVCSERFVALCVDSKRRIVERDEREGGLRRLLNLGHTYAHAIERCSGYRLTHGLCVARGLYEMIAWSERNGLISAPSTERIRAIYRRYDMPTDPVYDKKELIAAMATDKKTEGDEITLILPYEIGDCRPVRVPLGELEKFLQ